METAHFPSFDLKGLLQFELLKLLQTKTPSNLNQQQMFKMKISWLIWSSLLAIKKQTSKAHNSLLIDAIIYIFGPTSYLHPILQWHWSAEYFQNTYDLDFYTFAYTIPQPTPSTLLSCGSFNLEISTMACRPNLPIFVNNFLLEYSHALSFIHCLYTATAEWRSCNRDHMAY